MTNKGIFMLAATFLLGCGVGFIATQKVIEKKYADIAQEEIESVKKYYFEREQERLEKEQMKHPEQEHEEDRFVAKSSLNDLIRPNLYEEAKRNINIFKDRQKDPEDLLVDAAGMSEEDHRPVYKDPEPPYLIDVESFTDDYDHHDKISLYYYRTDGVLCDESHDVVYEIEKMVGNVDLDSALSGTTIAWVRNEAMGSDFEIVAMSSAYEDEVYGAVKEPAKKEKKKPKRGRSKEDEQ